MIGAYLPGYSMVGLYLPCYSKIGVYLPGYYMVGMYDVPTRVLYGTGVPTGLPYYDRRCTYQLTAQILSSCMERVYLLCDRGVPGLWNHRGVPMKLYGTSPSLMH